MDVHKLEQDAVSLAKRAVQCDQAGLTDTAISYYTEAADALLNANIAGSRLPQLREKVAELLEMERARFLLEKAFDEDGENNHEEAIDLYMEAAEFCLSLTKRAPDLETRNKVTSLAKQAVERAEALKGDAPKVAASSAASNQSPDPVRNIAVKNASGSDDRRQPVQVASGYTKEEIKVLRTTSYINGREYVPFLSVDVREKFALPLPFNDKRLLPLSAKQKASLNRWARPDEYMSDPSMVYAVSPLAIKQSIVSDCSFVASLAIAAQYERRFNTKLITSIIYPQNRKGDPQYNPCGKYMVKLNLNGVPRKVVIDDLLPIGHHGELLCSYSINRNELWVSLLEKAYLKVMGGYDFPGSNSNIDLHALTGWIPERVDLQDPEEFDPDKEFLKIQSRFHKGDCLVTTGTGELSDDEADRAGLVSTHAYAMLNIMEVKGHRLFQLKNPWNVKRWKGNFSDFDTVHWTPEMEKALSYNRKVAVDNDNGIFWIDFDSLRKFFKIIYINWNPALFAHTTCIHRTWRAGEGPRKDRYSVANNPQYRLDVTASGPSAVWILLSRHIMDKDDFADNKEFITIVVYKNEGKKVFYPNDPKPFKDGVRINTPHYLVKMTENKGRTSYTLIVSQYEKSHTIHYTLRVYSSCPFKLSPIADPYNPKCALEMTGEWKGASAGGCENNMQSYNRNPIYQVNIDNTSTNHLLVELRAPKEFNVGIAAVPVSHNIPQPESAMKKFRSGPLRRGYCILELTSLPGGLYNIMPFTFYAGQESKFILNVSSSCKISCSRIQ
ncbi:hypothetical protein CAPTEDRAFT_220858 [Capitella teleta]|uniref:Calpain catalytic domain-containing protein n=1 Tax=Capitella teleta TaxID=283909 RepID=R7V270_CAPTE|nr:hypothetical protein CAPTEDRAFT_220858 [Capitella teleta]|eukprot:ELU09786.1 hypothetical protein CAPTEDRAFT_220858 [Capitella teleta]